MSKKRTVNRYTIGQMDKLEVRKITHNGYIQELMNNIEKYNNNPKNQYFLGDIQIKRNEGIITFKRYIKITNPSTLAEIDKSTTYAKSEHYLKLFYKTNLKNHHPLVILYRVNKKIRTLPIIYDEKYIDREYVKESIFSNGYDINFINKILNNELIKSSTIKSLDDFDNLYALRESLKYNLPGTISLAPLEKFYSSFISEGKGKFNYFNFRLLSIILYDYEESQNKEEIKEETEEQEEVLGQMMIANYANLILKDTYEELELMVTEGSLDEVYGKKLIKAHKTTK